MAIASTILLHTTDSVQVDEQIRAVITITNDAAIPVYIQDIRPTVKMASAPAQPIEGNSSVARVMCLPLSSANNVVPASGSASFSFSLNIHAPSAAAGQSVYEGPQLGAADSFAILAGSAITNTGSSVITGDVGVSPGTSITPGAWTVNGTVHNADAAAAAAQVSLTAAYIDVASRTTTQDLTGQDLGSVGTLGPGVYNFASSAGLTGTLTLDAQGDPNAVFIFKIGSTLTTAASSVVSLINGAVAGNVFFQVGSSATLGITSTFNGNILALTSITDNGSTISNGRYLARNGAVTIAAAIALSVASNSGVSGGSYAISAQISAMDGQNIFPPPANIAVTPVV